MLFNIQDDEESGLAISDLMTALMALFLLGTLLALEKRDFISQHIGNSQVNTPHKYSKVENVLFSHLYDLAKQDSSLQWDEERNILTTWFKFESAKATLSIEAKNTLNSICPKLIEMVRREKNKIYNIVIRGHTDTSWSGKGNAFVGNMRVSYERAMNTMDHCLQSLGKNETAVATKFVAQGFSFSQANNEITQGKGDLQRRVEILFNYKHNSD
ncbi:MULTISPECIES: OmpA family protein [unclassified Pseudoalteromonas]|uniref:OmpA family protein n=1 Tax=unclassified Pseudoalteromonas TaxID=194690 RepID=UPI0005A6501B|nr:MULTISPECIES: OmpA family protein [unclassified Pseudoalteromonas]